ncbi:MAG: hypothetical protein IH868_11785, partial [Chloroflexi bacterium]|nr:hypothetical protein [Chloroflexota bacterium]
MSCRRCRAGSRPRTITGAGRGREPARRGRVDAHRNDRSRFGAQRLDTEFDAVDRADDLIVDDLVEEAAFGDAATTPAALWNRATAYRQAVAETMMTPLRDFLARRNFGEALGVDGLTMLEPLERLAEGAALHRTLPRPMALYAPEQEDPLPRRVRKSFARAKRRLQRAYRLSINRLRRLFRREPLPLSALHRDAPVRDLCR